MGTSPDQVRADIEATRARLSEEIDQLADRTSPRRMARRRADQARGAVAGLRERVMGAASDTTSQAGDTARHAADSTREAAGQAGAAVRAAPDQAVRQTRGNPLAAGLIAFGAGLLAASLAPPSEAERQAAAELSRRAGGAVEPVKEAAAESAQRLREDAMESTRGAAEEVKETAAEAARGTGEHAREQAGQVTDRAREGGRQVADETRGSGPE